MQWRVCGWLWLAATALGCGGSVDQGSPAGVAEAIVTAMDSGSVDIAVAVLAPETAVREALDCGPKDSLGRSLGRARDEVRASLEELAETGVHVQLKRFDEQGSETLKLAVGESWRDCKAKQPVEIHRARVTLVYRKGSRDDEDGERWDFIRIPPDTRWWYVPR